MVDEINNKKLLVAYNNGTGKKEELSAVKDEDHATKLKAVAETGSRLKAFFSTASGIAENMARLGAIWSPLGPTRSTPCPTWFLLDPHFAPLHIALG